jgi:hypothetical protein
MINSKTKQNLRKLPKLDSNGIAMLSSKDLKLLVILTRQYNGDRLDINKEMKYVNPVMYLRRTRILAKKGLVNPIYKMHNDREDTRGKPMYLHLVSAKGFQHLRDVRDILNGAIENENKK